MTRIALTRAAVFDRRRGELRASVTLVVDRERIADVRQDATRVDDARTIDLAGRTLLPGLIDVHLHMTACLSDFLRLALMPASLITARAKNIMARLLARGFTTVRDAPGALADLVADDGDPTTDLTLLQGQGVHMTLVMQGGRCVRDRLPIPTAA